MGDYVCTLLVNPGVNTMAWMCCSALDVVVCLDVRINRGCEILVFFIVLLCCRGDIRQGGYIRSVAYVVNVDSIYLFKFAVLWCRDIKEMSRHLESSRVRDK